MALTSNQETKIYPGLTRWEYPVLAGAIHFYKNAICNIQAGGFLKLGADAASEKFAGIALEELNQLAGGSNGDNKLKVIPFKSGEVVELVLTGVTQADVGVDAFVVDDGSVALAATTTNDVRVGTIIDISATANQCLVRLD